MPSNETFIQPATAPVDHIIAFGRVLRRAGLDVGSHQIMDAVRAVEAVGIRREDDVYQALFSVFVHRRDQVERFDEAFHLFWRAPAQLPDVMAMLLSHAKVPAEPPPPRRRVQEALQEPDEAPKGRRPDPSGEEETDVEVVASYSASEVLRTKDFAAFTAEEEAAAKAMIRQMRWPIPPRSVRRQSPREKGRALHLRATIRRSLRHHGEVLDLRFQGRKKKPRPVVVLCDISGSMEAYARMLLHFMHAVTGGLERVESFVFGTRLTRITHYLRRRDVDEAVTATAKVVNDWGGGTRIGEALKVFNYEWLRRVLRSDGVVLIISDGCDRGDTELLGREMGRLARNCHRLLWLNPLLGYEDYQPLTRGMRAALPHVDDFLPVHNLEALEQLGEVLSGLTRVSSWQSRFGRANGKKGQMGKSAHP